MREELWYRSTRGGGEPVQASQAILKGLADDGGLFVPERIPKLDIPMSELQKMDYRQVAYEVMKLFFADFTEEELKDCIARAYDGKFDREEIVPITKADQNYYLELFHGPTIAFKDMALSILPHLMTTSARKNHITNEIIILTATSGDTGKAALAGFADVPGTGIIVFYPKDGVSYIQKLQMVTQKGENTHVIGIEGNFDDAQSGVKAIFGNKELAERMAAAGYQFSSANSINIGRLVPQIVYYVYAYAKLCEDGELVNRTPVDICVPTGNFGNILAAYYAKCMGLPVGRLICASNDNKVLYDFFRTGTYDRNREFLLTASPSMDILISSNLERLIYKLAGENPEKNRELMQALSEGGRYDVTPEMREQMKEFTGYFATEEETFRAIRQLYEETGYVIDTHTAVAAAAVRKYRQAEEMCRAGQAEDDNVQEEAVQAENSRDAKNQDVKNQDAAVQAGGRRQAGKMLIASTASPFKFARSVIHAIDEKYDGTDEWKLIEELERISGCSAPTAVKEIKEAKVRHDRICAAADMQRTVEEILGLEKK